MTTNLFLLLAICLASPAAAQESPAADLQKQVTELAEAFEKSNKALVGVSVVNLRSQKSVAAFHDGQLMVPASNQKLLTSAAALAKLGTDFKFTTTVYLAGKDLLVVGDGDPTLGDPVLAQEANRTIYGDLDAWSAAVKAKVGARIEGDLLVCSSRDAFRSPDWPKAQYDRWYAAPVAELNFNNNCLDVGFVAKGGATVPVIVPETRFIQVVNKLQKGPKHLWALRCNADDSTVTLTGTVSQAASEPLSIAVNNPPLLLGRVLADRLARAGIHLGGSVRLVNASAVDLAKAQAICQTSTPLANVLRRANKRSLNMTAECLFLRVGDGAWPGSARIVTETLAKAYQLRPEQFTISDGGGLSRKNAVTPGAITQILSGVLKRKDANTFLDSLPVSGVDGTMEHRLSRLPYQGRVLGKTGYVAGVSTLSGYILDGAGRPAYAFSVLVNKIAGPAEAKKLEEDICILLVDTLPVSVQPVQK